MMGFPLIWWNGFQPENESCQNEFGLGRQQKFTLGHGS
jgi:hypothetical protein